MGFLDCFEKPLEGGGGGGGDLDDRCGPHVLEDDAGFENSFSGIIFALFALSEGRGGRHADVEKVESRVVVIAVKVQSVCRKKLNMASSRTPRQVPRNIISLVS